MELKKRKEAKRVEETSPQNTDESLHPNGAQAQDRALVQEETTYTVPYLNFDEHNVRRHETKRANIRGCQKDKTTILTKIMGNASQQTQSQLTHSKVSINHHQRTPSNKHRDTIIQGIPIVTLYSYLSILVGKISFTFFCFSVSLKQNLKCWSTA